MTFVVKNTSYTMHQLYFENENEQKILAIKDKNISDFNYTLQNNLLCIREIMKRWKIVQNDTCVFVKM